MSFVNLRNVRALLDTLWFEWTISVEPPLKFPLSAQTEDLCQAWFKVNAHHHRQVVHPLIFSYEITIIQVRREEISKASIASKKKRKNQSAPYRGHAQGMPYENVWPLNLTAFPLSDAPTPQPLAERKCHFHKQQLIKFGASAWESRGPRFQTAAVPGRWKARPRLTSRECNLCGRTAERSMESISQ